LACPEAFGTWAPHALFLAPESTLLPAASGQLVVPAVLAHLASSSWQGMWINTKGKRSQG